MHDIVSAKYVDSYKIELAFDDGKIGVVDFSVYLNKHGVFEKFRDLGFFKSFRLDQEIGNITWNDEIDISPEVLYSAATHSPLPAWMETNN